MAEEIAAGAKGAGASVDVLNVEQVDVKGLREYDAIVFGSPTYYGTMAAPVKEVFDESVKLHGKLAGRVGGAFTSSGARAGGNETTVLDILKAWLVHGMMVMGDAGSDHYGPVAIGTPDEKALRSCHEYGRRLTELAAKVRAG
jgi:NAD(P)H dehydrogenase (quinone)